MAKKEDISNSTLATLLVVAIVVSVGGTYVVLQRAPGITGLYTGTTAQGTINFNEMGVLSIVMRDNKIGFGNITQNAAGSCIVDSEGAAYSGTNCNKSADADWFELENDGNVNATVKVNITTPFPNGLGTGELQEMKQVSNNTDGACISGAVAYATITNVAPVTMCTILNPTDATDTINLFMRLTLGQDALPGNQTETVTFWASQAN